MSRITNKKNIPVDKNNVYSVSVTGTTLEGMGVGRIDNYAVFIKDAIPGEKVKTRIIKITDSFAIGRIEEIEERSIYRKKPDCLYYKQCGGCTFQHISYEGQLLVKQKVVEDCIHRLGGFSAAEALPIIPSLQPYRYRNKGAFPCGMTETGKMGFGFYAYRSHTLVKVCDCILESEKIIEGVHAIEKWAEEEKISPYDENKHTGFLRHAVFRETSLGKLMCTIVTTGKLKNSSAFVSYLSMADSIYININRSESNVIFGNEFFHLAGDKTLEEKICGHTYRISPATFLQVNHSQTERLYSTALRLLDPQKNETAYDLYCGMGSISLYMAPFVKKLIGIESVPDAIRDAKENAEINGITNVDFLCGNTEDLIDQLCESEPADIIMLDPPRKGCEVRVLQAIRNSTCTRLVYVSCNPATLARDLKILCSDGRFYIKTIQPIDMFPQTSHVETVCLIMSEVASRP